MENQELLNAISTLNGSIDPLIRAKNHDALEKVILKLIELVAKL